MQSFFDNLGRLRILRWLHFIYFSASPSHDNSVFRILKIRTLGGARKHFRPAQPWNHVEKDRVMRIHWIPSEQGVLGIVGSFLHPAV